MTSKDFQKNVLALPWVKAVTKDTRCEGIKWGSVAMKDIYVHGPDRSLPPRGIQERAKCKRRAKYRLRATVRGTRWDNYAKSGDYCATHLSMQIADHSAESKRADRFFDKNGWWRNGVFGFYGIGKVEVDVDE